MNYARHYDALMTRAATRQRPPKVERHHIVQVCMGGDNASENIALLTPEEHFVAHQLLVKMYPDNAKLVWAIARMSGKGSAVQARNNKIFGWLRRKLSDAASARAERQVRASPSPETREKIAAAQRGRPVSAERRQKMSEAAKRRFLDPKQKLPIIEAGKRGRGRKQSAEWVSKRVAAVAASRQPMSLDKRAAVAEAQRMRWLDPDYRAHMCAVRVGTIVPEDRRLKIAASMRALRQKQKEARST